MAQVHRCPRHQLPMQLTLIGTLVSRLSGEAEDQAGADARTPLTPAPASRSGLEPIILHLSGILCLPPRNTGLQPSPQSLTQLRHRIITAKNESCIEVKQCFPVTFHRRRCITTVERDNKAVGRIRAREEGVLVLKAPRGCCKTDPGTQGMRADKSEDCLHGPG